VTAPSSGALDVLVVSLGSTAGLREADAQLVADLRGAGAAAEIVSALAPAPIRTLALTDLGWARAARRAAQRELARRRVETVLYSSTTAALLWPRPGAVRFDAPAVGNRPGRHGLWQRRVEHRRLAEAPLLVPWSTAALQELGPSAKHAPVVVVPVAVEPSGPPAARRDIAAVSYAANPHKKGIDRVLDAWRAVRRPGEELVLAGADLDVDEDGVRITGPLPAPEYRALVRRARAFVCAPRREDYGLAQLEALADGCVLVTTPAPGPYAALPLARALDPRCVSEQLGDALRAALDAPAAGYGERALQLLAPYRREAVRRQVATELLPRLR
jgi:glycosyltransferase involved in cell wall biosynthesis